MKYINKLYYRLKNNIVLSASLILATITIFFIRTNIKDYFTKYINYNVLVLLFCFMISIAGFSKYGVLKHIALNILKKTKNTREVSIFIVLISFFSAMFITNDVALITFVPISLILFKEAHNQSQLIKVITLQTIAANLGSILTPFGNPQNLFLYTFYNMNFLEFIKITAIPTLIGLVLLLVSCLLVVPKEVHVKHNYIKLSKKRAAFYLVMFLLSILPVFHVWHYLVSLVIIFVAILIFDRGIFRRIDYELLLTFVCFFIFIGNIQKIQILKDFLRNILNNPLNVYIYSVIVSQFISNVPCAILLANWTDCVKAIILGVNVGGLGTLIASLANIISYNYFINFRKSQKTNFIKYFSLVNVVYLVVIFGIVLLVVR